MIISGDYSETIMDEETLPSPPSPHQPAGAPLIRQQSSPVTTTFDTYPTESNMETQRPHTHHQQLTQQQQHPVYIPEDVVLPPEFELRESCIVEAGLGVFSLVDIPVGERFGPFAGVERLAVKDTQCAWEVSSNSFSVFWLSEDVASQAFLLNCVVRKYLESTWLWKNLQVVSLNFSYKVLDLFFFWTNLTVHVISKWICIFFIIWFSTHE